MPHTSCPGQALSGVPQCPHQTPHRLELSPPRPAPSPPQILPVGVGAISPDGAHSHPWQPVLSEVENPQDAQSEPEYKSVCIHFHLWSCQILSTACQGDTNPILQRRRQPREA